MKGDITQPALFMTVRLPYPTLPSPIHMWEVTLCLA
jgi:hypothetical protein